MNPTLSLDIYIFFFLFSINSHAICQDVCLSLSLVGVSLHAIVHMEDDDALGQGEQEAEQHPYVQHFDVRGVRKVKVP